jgi:hypothetical protein
MVKSFIVRRAAELKAVGAEVLRDALCVELVRKVLGGLEKRKRVFDALTTWVIFLGQTLAADHSCRSALAQARAAGLLSVKASVHTGAYCQARDRLPEEALHRLASGLGGELSQGEVDADRWHGRRVVVADGSSVTLPDSPENQAAYPQPRPQLPGCGFPVMYLCTLMSLASGALLDFATGSGNGNELTLWRRLWDLLQLGDIVLGDSKYCSYADLALLRQRAVDVVARLGIRKSDFRIGRILGIEDHITCWYAPEKFPVWLGSQVLPPYMPVRELRFKVETPGFRVHSVTLVTTLLDSEVYPKEDLAELFFSRWQVELRLRDIKTMLGMDRLRTKTPERARKELWMFLAAYNLLRSLMYSAAQEAGIAVARISFQGCRQRLLAAATHLGTSAAFTRQYRRLMRDLAHDQNPERPFRFEPRAVKRRPKQYDLLNKPRAVLKRLLEAA